MFCFNIMETFQKNNELDKIILLIFLEINQEHWGEQPRQKNICILKFGLFSLKKIFVKLVVILLYRLLDMAGFTYDRLHTDLSCNNTGDKVNANNLNRLKLQLYKAAI